MRGASADWNGSPTASTAGCAEKAETPIHCGGAGKSGLLNRNNPMIAQPMRTATAQQLAAALQADGHPVSRSGGWHRTRGLCHGGDAPDTLTFRDGERPGESSLLVHCYKCGASSTVIRHALQAATGLPLCRCRACWQAWRAGQTVHRPSNRGGLGSA